MYSSTSTPTLSRNKSFRHNDLGEFNHNACYGLCASVVVKTSNLGSETETLGSETETLGSETKTEI